MAASEPRLAKPNLTMPLNIRSRQKSHPTDAWLLRRLAKWALAETGPGREDAPELPMPAIPADQRAGPLAEAKAEADAEMLREHWRLLYVGMTRAEEALFVTGSLGAREKAPHGDSWYARLEPLFDPDGWVEGRRGIPVNVIGGPGEPHAATHADGSGRECSLPAQAPHLCDVL